MNLKKSRNRAPSRRTIGSSMIEMLAVMSVILVLLSFAAVNSVGLKKKESESKAKMMASLLQNHLSNFATTSDATYLRTWEVQKLAGASNKTLFDSILSKHFSASTDQPRAMDWTKDFEPVFQGYIVTFPQNPFGSITVVAEEDNLAIYP